MSSFCGSSVKLRIPVAEIVFWKSLMIFSGLLSRTPWRFAILRTASYFLRCVFWRIELIQRAVASGVREYICRLASKPSTAASSIFLMIALVSLESIFPVRHSRGSFKSVGRDSQIDFVAIISTVLSVAALYLYRISGRCSIFALLLGLTRLSSIGFGTWDRPSSTYPWPLRFVCLSRQVSIRSKCIFAGRAGSKLGRDVILR